MKLASPAVRARIFNLLAARVARGASFAQALQTLAGEPNADRALWHARVAMDRGLSFTRAGMSTGLFSPLEATLLDAAYAVGRLPLMLRRLAVRLEGRLQHRRALRQRLAVPVLALVISTLLLPLSLATSFGAVGRSLYYLFVATSLGALAFVLLVLPRMVDSTRFDPGDGLLSEIAFTWPRLAAMKRRRNAASFLEALGLLLQADVALESAIPRATLAVSGDSARTDLKRISQALAQGKEWEQALELARGLDPVSHNVLLSGAATGRLAEFALQRGAQLLEEIRNKDLLLVRGFSRAVYGLVLLWLAADVFG